VASATGSVRLIRVAIVDDHPALREGTASLLGREPDIEVVAALGSLDEIRALVDGPEPPDVVVQDIRLGEESGLRMLTGDRPAGRRPQIILWPPTTIRSTRRTRIVPARRASWSRPRRPRSCSRRSVESRRGGLHFSSRPEPGTLTLTSREREVLDRVVEGKSNDEIGHDMGITTRTVEAHLTRLYERFDVRSRTELATRAVREGWLDVPAESG
jgi:DNA-binding NarL/FixJ family response regulator